MQNILAQFQQQHKDNGAVSVAGTLPEHCVRLRKDLVSSAPRTTTQRDEMQPQKRRRGEKTSNGSKLKKVRAEYRRRSRGGLFCLFPATATPSRQRHHQRRRCILRQRRGAATKESRRRRTEKKRSVQQQSSSAGLPARQRGGEGGGGGWAGLAPQGGGEDGASSPDGLTSAPWTPSQKKPAAAARTG